MSMSVDPLATLLPSSGLGKEVHASVVDEAAGGADNSGVNPEQYLEKADTREPLKSTLAPAERFPPSRGARGRVPPSVGVFNASTVTATVAGLAQPWACSRWKEGILQDAAANLEKPGVTSRNMGSPDDSAECSGRVAQPDSGCPRETSASEASTAPWCTEGETSRVVRAARERRASSRRCDRHVQDPYMGQIRHHQETRIDVEGAGDETSESQETLGRTNTVHLEDRSLIRTLGRRRRGPCMLTLSSEGVQGMNEGIECRTIVWEVETEGGLVSPGGIRVLVC